MQEMRAEMNERFEDVFSKEDGDRILRTLDSLHTKADMDDTERLVMTRQLDRHEEWIERASGKLKVNYDPGAGA